MTLIDEAQTVRSGEELDGTQLECFLRQSIPGLEGNMQVEQFPSGYSNLTYLLKVGDRELVLRRPPFGTKAKSAHDMHREYRVLKAIHPVFPYAPKPLVYTDDESIMGAQFYVMERIRGIILHQDIPADLDFSPENVGALHRSFADLFAELHAVDYVQAGLQDFGKPQGYVQRQIDGWIKRYRNAKTPDAPDFEPIMAWLADKMPAVSPKPALIHNDFKLNNLVLDPEDPLKIIGVLDWEMTTIGDPLMDLGASLAYWMEKTDPPEMLAIRRMPTHVEGALTREEIVTRYLEQSGISIDCFDFYYGYGLFRLAAIDQQIYYRYFNGQTRDERFKSFIDVVGVLHRAAQRLIA